MVSVDIYGESSNCLTKMEYILSIYNHWRSEIKYNNYQIRGLPKPLWGQEVPKEQGLACASCGSNNIYYSASPEDPEEILLDTVRCRDCGWLTDWYEDYKAGHPEEYKHDASK